MKKIFYASCLLFASISTFVSCQKDEESDFVLSAIIADTPKQSNNSKVYIESSGSDCRVCWHNNDYININGQKCTLNVANSTYAATISGVNVDATGNGYSAVYPYDEGAISGSGSTTAIVTVPSSQTYVKRTDGNGHSYQEVAAPMVAHCDASNNVLKFHNAAGIIRVNVKNSSSDTKADDIKVHYISITAGESAPLAGTGEVPTNTASPLLSVTDNASSTITLDCCHDETDNHPVIAVGKSETFYLVAAPFTGKTLTIKVMTEVTTDNTKKRFIFSKTTNTSLSLDRNNVGSVSIELTNSNYQEVEFLGAGTKDCPYLITNLTDLGNLRTQVAEGNSLYNSNSIYYKQTENITLSSWTSAIGTESYPFAGNYDGDGNSITAIPSCGLFAFAGGGRINNLTVATNELSYSSTTNFGSIVNYVTADLSISNCTATAKVSTTISGSVSGIGIGGIVGYSNASVSISDCETTNESYITHTKNTINHACMGGIIGNNNGANSTVIDCSNNAYIAFDVNQSGCSGNWGGICGYTNADIIFTRCNNCRAMYWTGSNSSITYYSNFGGILGASGGTAKVSFDNCNNTSSATISYNTLKTSQGCHRGGIMGYSNSTGKIAITNCHNYAAISTYASGTGNYIGGIVGYVTASSSLEVTGCTNGTIESIDGTVLTSNATGGICGYTTAKTTIKNCQNYMWIRGNTNVGGIVGYATNISIESKDAPINVINYGQVEGSSCGGGILGCVNGSSVSINGAKNKGTVTLTGAKAGGIVGDIIISGESMLSKCINENNISGAGTGVGGIVGRINESSDEKGITILNCEHQGNITNTNGQGGGIVGYITRESSTHPNVICTILNSCSKGNISGSSQTSGICAVGKDNNTSNRFYIEIHNCYYSGSLSGPSGRIASVIRNAIDNFISIKYSYCYASSNCSLGSNEYVDVASVKQGCYNAARTFDASTGLYAGKGASVSDDTWATGVSLVDALNAQCTESNGYKAWSVPEGKVLPTLGL